MPQPAVACPLTERELSDQLRLDPVGALRDGVDVGEGRIPTLQLAHPPAKVLQGPPVEPGPHLPGIAELPALVVADEQGAAISALAMGRGGAGDHELLLV